MTPNIDRRDLDLEGYCKASVLPRWNQRFYFNFYDPEQNIGAFIRIGVMENLKQTNNWFVFFKNGRALYNRVNMHHPYTDERLDNGIVVAGISMRSIIPLQQANVTFSEPDFQVDLTWTGITPMQDCIDLTSDSGGSFASEVAHAHLEQVCQVTGQIVMRDGEVIPIDSKGFRDLSVVSPVRTNGTDLRL